MAIALVKLGTVASAATNTITPAFGQATGAGNLLIAWVVQNNTTSNPTTSSSGWTRAAGTGPDAAVFFKPNSAAGESAPTFSVASAFQMFALLGEFSGADTASPSDQGNFQNSSGSPITVTNSLADATSGELVVTAGWWNLSKAGTCTTADTYNNGATPNGNLNNDASSVATHYRFAWGITTSNASGDSNSQSNNSKNLQVGNGVCIASFKLPAAAAAAVPNVVMAPYRTY